tara:strand:+ start:717 stop:1532 length:816 start_codon:yes stop_codon:yes gene_type:complete
MDNPSHFLNFAINTAKKAGQIQMSYFGNYGSLLSKSSNIDLVTKADLKSEEFIIKSIQDSFPSHSILSEEIGEIDSDSEYLWIIDPLDGTTNFAHNLPIFSVSIGLVKKGQGTICGTVYNPAADKLFYAIKNKGAFLNDLPISVTSSNTLSESLLVTGFPYSHDKFYDLSFSIFKDFYDKTQGVRRLGAASLDLCFVAMGRFDGFYEFNLKSWDICAGSLIAQEAGATCSDWDNSSLPRSGKRVLCSNGKIHNEMIKILNKDKYQIFYDLK